MKIKKTIFTFTGEKTSPKAGDWFHRDGEYIRAGFDYSNSYEIVTREEILEDWKPKETEVIFFITTTAGSLQVMATNYVEGAWTDGNVKDGNCFPTRELAEAKLSEIKTLLK